MSAATEVARRIAASTNPHTTCRLLVEYAAVQPRGEGDDRVLLASLRTLDEVRAGRPPVDVLSERRARPYGLWIRLTGAVDRLARMRGWS